MQIWKSNLDQEIKGENLNYDGVFQYEFLSISKGKLIFTGIYSELEIFKHDKSSVADTDPDAGSEGDSGSGSDRERTIERETDRQRDSDRQTDRQTDINISWYFY